MYYLFLVHVSLLYLALCTAVKRFIVSLRLCGNKQITVIRRGTQCNCTLKYASQYRWRLLSVFLFICKSKRIQYPSHTNRIRLNADNFASAYQAKLDMM